ncbi:MAG: DUF11 domain-containing protein, partial [Planctomycetia bacterium]|nr:DUF11 domain-containing protein [Planctomycetia bacterium]
MKRLWMRLGVVAGILGVGGAGVLVAKNSGSSPEAPAATASATEGPAESNGQPRPIALPQSSYGAGDNSYSAPVASNHVAGYSNELEPSEPPDAARFVDSASPSQSTKPQYASSPASYSINDAEGNLEPPPGQYPDAAPQSSYAPSGSDGNDDAPATSPATSAYASRYGDPVGEEGGTGASLSSPQELTEPGNRYGASSEPASEDAAPVQPDSTAEPAPQQAAIAPVRPTIANAPTYQEPAAVAANEATIELPPLRGDTPPASSSYAPLQMASSVPQSQLPSSNSIGPATAAASVVASPLSSDIPGDRGLEGTQTPTLTLEKRAPTEVSVGQSAPFKIIVRNVGNVTAHGVLVTDRVPQGTKLVDASPEFTQTSDGAIAWQLGDLEPGDQAQVSIELMPLAEGEIGSVAQVSFRAQASVRTVSTKPDLVVKQTGPDKVLIGEDVVFDITLSNPGSGATTGIVVEEDVPAGLAHVAGEKLEFEVGTLRPKEEKRLQLILRADKAGVVTNLLRVKADAGLEASDPFKLEV